MVRHLFFAVPLLACLALIPSGSLHAQSADDGVAADVLARTIQRGELVSERDFAVEEIPAARARGIVSAQEAAGLEARRTLRKGMPVRASDLAELRLVKRGEPVKLTLREGALTISVLGRALGDGAMGEQVRVFSEATNQTLAGVVEGSGVVRILAP
ncbi:flagellar basal body P-ring formation chaperone FlgA [Pseudoblastomonas halimionae]|uniref:Flagella basal body P-ring formation protein FlgA n=1 Tax=Alteriqipengyuania halimionae TaxID=1926630 RepID=A0A6I4U3C3_9SPHN|nr:flagellar basal body P-ring formation chaperone FlgA [Alteriqipengyuania halimionae]MXP10428.1 flagellar basal body P-ring formation protein FlgA [Alteriqipengyuania halimionae]